MCVSVCALFYVGLSCQDVSSFGNNLSRCVVFRQGGSVFVCVSVCALFYVGLSCQDVSFFGNNLSRCVVFRQGGSVCVCLSVLCSIWALVVQMCRLSATTCQDVSSLGRGALCVSVCTLFYVSLSCHLNTLRRASMTLCV